MKKYLPALAALALVACAPGAVDTQDADGAEPASDAAYDGVLFKRGNVVVSDPV